MLGPDERRDVVADALSERGRGAARRDADDDRVAAHERRQDERAELGVVGDVAEQRAPGRGARDAAVDRAVVRRGDDEQPAVEIRRRGTLAARAAPAGGAAPRRPAARRPSRARRSRAGRAPSRARPIRRRRRGSRGRAGRGTPCSSGRQPPVPRLVRRAPVASRRTAASSPSASIVSVNAPGATPRCGPRRAASRASARSASRHLARAVGARPAARQPPQRRQRPPARRPGRSTRGSGRSAGRARAPTRAARRPRRSTSPSSTAATSSARRPRIVSSRAIACTVCTSASATSRASPRAASLSLLADQRTQLVLEAAGLDRAVDAALLRRVRLPPPAAGAQVLARLGRRACTARSRSTCSPCRRARCTGARARARSPTPRPPSTPRAG